MHNEFTAVIEHDDGWYVNITARRFLGRTAKAVRKKKQSRAWLKRSR